jgi:catechol-2,3-dioxygenase
MLLALGDLPMAATPKLAHIVLMTNRLQAMRDWYMRVLTAHVVYENPGLCFLTFDDEHHRLALVSPPGATLAERTPLTTGMHHSAYTFPTLADLLETFGRLATSGIEPLTPIQHGVTTSLYYRDPDGNLVELQIDNFASAAEATDYMLGTEFAADPIGPAFDPRAMASALAAGTPVRELTTRAWALAGPPMPDPMARMMGLLDS